MGCERDGALDLDVHTVKKVTEAEEHHCAERLGGVSQMQVVNC